jgi:hypothetical protein
MDHITDLPISWRWTNAKDLSKEDKQFLDNEAKSHIFSKIKEGFIAGELHTEINDVEYSGYWTAHY